MWLLSSLSTLSEQERFVADEEDDDSVMDPRNDPSHILAFSCWIIALLLNVNEAVVPVVDDGGRANENTLQPNILDLDDTLVLHMFSLFSSTLYNYNLCLPTGVFIQEVAFWVEPRSTTWFAHFLMEQYDDRRWIPIFQMTKGGVQQLSELLRPAIEKKNTNYRFAIPVFVRVACTLFKLF